MKQRLRATGVVVGAAVIALLAWIASRAASPPPIVLDGTFTWVGSEFRWDGEITNNTDKTVNWFYSTLISNSEVGLVDGDLGQVVLPARTTTQFRPTAIVTLSSFDAQGASDLLLSGTDFDGDPLYAAHYVLNVIHNN